MNSVGRLIAALGAAVLVVGLPMAAAAADDSDLTWSVHPTTAYGAQVRPWVELELDPGQTASDSFEVENFSSRPVTFRIDAADGYFTDTGRFNMLPLDKESTDAGLWIEVADSVTVAAGGSAIVPFTVTVPDNATPGDHPAGIAASVTAADVDQDGKAVSVDSRVGFRVMTRVSGEFAPAVQSSVQVAYDGSWNPFSPGTAIVRYTVANTGNTRLSVDSTLVVAGPFGLAPQTLALEPIEEIAPGEERTQTQLVRNVWPLGIVTASLHATAHEIIDTGGAQTVEAEVAGAASAAIPWPQLVAIALIVLIIVVWTRGRRRDRDRLAAALEAAREEGRLAAQPADASSQT